MFEENDNNNSNNNINNYNNIEDENPFKNISNKISSHHQSKDFDLINNNNLNNIERNSTPNFNNNNNYYYYNINNNISEYNKDFLRRSEIYNNNNNENNSFNSISNRAYQITDNIKTKSKETLNKIGSKLNQTITNFPNTFSNISTKIKNNFNKNNNNNNKITKDNSLFSTNNNNNNNLYLDSRSSFAGNFGINSNNLPQNLIQNKSEIHLNKFNISVNISNFETKSSTNEEIIYYQIDLYSNLSKKEWSVFHKFNDFYEMNLIFKKYFTKAPNFPNNSLIKISDLSEIIHRKDALNTYIKEVCDRPDLFTSIYCVKFLKLENHYPDIELFYPLELLNFVNQLILPISVSYFLNHANLLFIGCGKSKNFFFENFINKIKNLNPFHSNNNDYNNNNNKNKIVKGQFAILNIIKNYQNTLHIEPLFAKPLFSEVTAINFFKNKNCLTVGCNDGTLIVYKIYINESTQESQGQFIIEAGTINVNNNKSIIGTIINFNIGYIYIFTNDCYVKVYTLNYLTYVKEYLITLKNLTCFKFDEINFHAICGDENGNIYIYDLKCENNNSNEIYKPIQLLNYVSGMNVIITCFYLNVDNDILIVAFKGGNVLFYKLNFNNNNNNNNFNVNNGIKIDCVKKMEIDKNVEITEIIITERGEMIFALSNGSAVIYYNSDKIPEFTLDAHLKSISNMFYIEEKKSLITCSEDKTIKIIQLPVYYPDKMLMKEDKYNEEFNNNNIIDYNDKKINNSINKLFGNNDNNNYNYNEDDDYYDYENENSNNNNKNIFKDNDNNNNNKINKYLEKNIFEDRYYDKIIMNKKIDNDDNNNNVNEYKNFKIFSEDLDGWSPILIDYVE